MKNYIITAFLCFFTTVNFAQDITWEKDFPKALRSAEQIDALLLMHFTDGSESSIEKNIKRNILKSKKFKRAIKKSIIILHVDESVSSLNKDFNKRVISTYNENKKFPAIRVIIPKSRKSASLLSKFNDKDIEDYILEINS